MALKSSQNKFSHTNKPNENDDDQSLHGEGSSQNLSEFRRRSRSFRKRNSRRSLNSSRSMSCGRINSHIPIVPMVPPPLVTVPSMSAYYRGQSLSYPVRLPTWDIQRLRIPNPLYRIPLQPIHIPIISPQMLPPLCPYPGGYTYTPPALAPMLPTPVIIDELSAVSNYQNIYSPEQIVPNDVCERYSEVDGEPQLYEATNALVQSPSDQLDSYLSLPREIFPSAMMLTLDPNPIIDGFCKYNAVLDQAPWILDLEFGVPREATTRPIAMYDVKYNSIHCKNTPNAIHPGFESCDPEFKSVLTFYYDCVISMWYRGYIFLNQDRSVENFQSWLSPPMQEFGMCWP